MNEIWTQEEEASRLHARFDALKKTQGIGQAEFARTNNVPGGPSMLSQHIKGRRPLSLEAATAYAKGFGCSLAEISPRLAKEVQAAAGAYPAVPTTSNIEPAIASAVPVVSWVQAGEWCGMPDSFEVADTTDWLPCPVRHGPRTYALIVRGVSMFDPTGARSFKDGDTIFVDPDRQADHRSLVIARLDDEKEATFKQLIIEADGQRMLQALNPSWPNRIIPINANCTICGVVIGKVESFI